MAGLEDTINQEEPHSGEIKPKLVSQADEKKFLGKIKKRNKYLLIDGLTDEEKQRIADHIIEQYRDAEGPHQELCEKIDSFDECSRLVRMEVQGTDGNMPNYRSPLSFVTHEVIHANIMNVFFTPKEPMRVLPTAADDIPKVNSISTFGNWSMKNEMDLFNMIDQLFHGSTKNGEAVYMVYWKKEYGVEIKREPMVDDKGNTVYDKDTQEPIFQEIEEPKLIYNAPFMEVRSRKDYMQPRDARMGVKNEWDIILDRISYDVYLRDELQGKFYDRTIDKIKDWPATSASVVPDTNYDGDDILIGKWKKQFITWYGRMKINVVEEGLKEQEAVKAHELEDEFIAVVNIATRTLCSLRKNRFPMKMRPMGIDRFIPDDTGRAAALGVYELLDSLQKCYDALFNTFIYATQLSNNPVFFYTPTGNTRDEKFRVQSGFMYPSSDPKSVQMFQFKGPDGAIKYALQLVEQSAQLMFGISDYAAGMQSTIDPRAPAKKVEIIVDQGNVRLNMIIKRKADTLRDIFKRWFLLYQANMPPNKFMRIAGEGDDPFKFESISYEDFALKSIPDFELVGNVLNANKQLELQKAIAVYQMLAPSPLFSPQTSQGLQGLMSLTKWLVNKIDDSDLTAFLPQLKEGDFVHTPEEENALMLQGQTVEPMEHEDHIYHLKIHGEMLTNPNTPPEIIPELQKHIQKTVGMLKQQATAMMAMQHQAQKIPPMQGGQPIALPIGGGGIPGGQNGVTPGAFGASQAPNGVLPQQPAFVG